LVAASVLGEHFKGDGSILERIMSRGPKLVFSEQRIAALCEGWYQTDELNVLWEEILQKQPELSAPLTCKLVCCKSSSNGVFQLLIGLLSRYDTHFKNCFPSYRAPAVRRLGTDGILAEMMLEHLRAKATPSEKGTLPRLIAASRGLSDELLSWSRSEANRQLTSVFPEIGLDLYVGHLRPVAHSLLDVIHSQ